MSEQTNNQVAPAVPVADPVEFDKNEYNFCSSEFSKSHPALAQRFADALTRIAKRKQDRIAENIDGLREQITQRDATILDRQRDLASVNAQLTRANESIAALQRKAEELEQLKAMIRNASHLAIMRDGVLVAPAVLGPCPKCNVHRGAMYVTDHCSNCIHANDTTNAAITATFTQVHDLIA